MKLNEVLNLSMLDKRRSSRRAKRIATKARAKAKVHNPGDEDTPSGWRADPHQGSLGGSLHWR